MPVRFAPAPLDLERPSWSKILEMQRVGSLLCPRLIPPPRAGKGDAAPRATRSGLWAGAFPGLA